MIYTIAEVGVNHGGYLDRAYELVIAAKEAGADAVKFQHFDARALGDPTLKRFELGLVGLYEMKRVAEEIGIDFLCTPFGVPQLTQLMEMHLSTVKLSHRVLPDLWADVARYDVRIIASAPNFAHAMKVTNACYPDVLLYVTTGYPTDDADVNLRVMRQYRDLASEVGYSDHTRGIRTALKAAEMGATVIEKHLTLDDEGCEAAWSATPEEFAKMVRNLQ